MNKTMLQAQTVVNAPIETIWQLWASPQDIMQWNNMSPEWHTPHAENDMCAGGRFLYVMALKDGSFQFDFAGTYDEVKVYEFIAYTLDDGRKSAIEFLKGEHGVSIIENFEANPNEPAEIQLRFCNAVLQSFKEYAERKAGLPG